MPCIRIIPRLDIKGPNLVKGIHLEGLRVLGKPEHFAKLYYESGADELFYQDVVASLFERNSLRELISRTARNTFIPLTVGGGLRTLDDISSVLSAGADKVAINTAAIRNPKLISQAAVRFGSSTIVVAIECMRSASGEFLAFTDNGREQTGINAVDWAIQAEKLGAGEILITSVDREGTGEGYDMELTAAVADQVSVPVIAHGGAGSCNDVADVLRKTGISAVAMAGILHYSAVQSIPDEDSSMTEGNREFLLSGRSMKRIRTTTLPELKNYLIGSGFPIRKCQHE